MREQSIEICIGLLSVLIIELRNLIIVQRSPSTLAWSSKSYATKKLKRKFTDYHKERPDIFSLINLEALAHNTNLKHMVDEIHSDKTVDYLCSLSYLKFEIDNKANMRFITSDNPVVINGGKPWPLNFLTLALTPTVLLIGHNFNEKLSQETINNLCLTHNLLLLKQSNYIFSQDKLQDNDIILQRKAAKMMLKSIPFSK